MAEDGDLKVTIGAHKSAFILSYYRYWFHIIKYFNSLKIIPPLTFKKIHRIYFFFFHFKVLMEDQAEKGKFEYDV